jgi:serine/threonine protein kinase
MHQLKIVHSDIKPTNVMYSTSYRKNLFLDFGISEVIDEEIWECTLAKFKGTYEFCGEEMKKLFKNRRSELVNLYINDLQMLLQTLRIFKKDLSQKAKANHF